MLDIIELDASSSFSSLILDRASRNTFETKNADNNKHKNDFIHYDEVSTVFINLFFILNLLVDLLIERARLSNTQDVRNFCLRYDIFINNAKENYVSQMMKEFTERKVSPRIWIATQIIGTGADMLNVRKLICMQNKYHTLTDELEKQVLGRCERERI